MALACALPFLPVGPWFGFGPPPPLFFAYLAGVTAVYLAVVEGVKWLFYERGI